MMTRTETTGDPTPRSRNALVKSASLAALVVLLASLCLLSVAVGTRDVPWTEILGALQGQIDSVGEAAVAMRLPRTALAIIAGSALGLAIARTIAEEHGGSLSAQDRPDGQPGACLVLALPEMPEEDGTDG